MNLKHIFCKEMLCQEEWGTSCNCSRIILRIQIGIISFFKVHAQERQYRPLQRPFYAISRQLSKIFGMNSCIQVLPRLGQLGWVTGIVKVRKNKSHRKYTHIDQRELSSLAQISVSGGSIVLVVRKESRQN